MKNRYNHSAMKYQLYLGIAWLCGRILQQCPGVESSERFIYYRKSVLNLLKHMFHVHLSLRCSTDLR